MGKGSERRQPQITREELEKRWQETFGKKVAKNEDKKGTPSGPIAD